MTKVTVWALHGIWRRISWGDEIILKLVKVNHHKAVSYSGSECPVIVQSDGPQASGLVKGGIFHRTFLT